MVVSVLLDDGSGGGRVDRMERKKEKEKEKENEDGHGIKSMHFPQSLSLFILTTLTLTPLRDLEIILRCFPMILLLFEPLC